MTEMVWTFEEDEKRITKMISKWNSDDKRRRGSLRNSVLIE